MATDIIARGMAAKAAKAKPPEGCIVKKTEDTADGVNITFEYTLEDGTVEQKTVLLKNGKDGVDGVVVWIGVNGIVNKDNVKNTTELLTKLSERYPGKKIYVMKVFPVGKNWKYGNMVADEMNPGIKEFNTEIEKFVNENNMTYIDATKEFVDENGYLVGSSDDLHLFEEEDNKKILDVVKSVIEKSNK